MLRKINISILVSITIFFASLALSFLAPTKVAAEHGECANQGSATSIERCVQNARQNALDDCQGRGEAAAEQCVRAVNEHYQSRPVDPSPDAPQTPQRNSYDGDCRIGAGEQLNKNNCGIIAYLVTFTRALSVIVGIVVTIMIVWGGIMYTSSRDNPQQTAAAKGHIINALIALIVYIFMVAGLNFIVPGGVL